MDSKLIQKDYLLQTRTTLGMWSLGYPVDLEKLKEHYLENSVGWAHGNFRVFRLKPVTICKEVRIAVKEVD